MSSFSAQAEHKGTGEIVDVWCIDDYFGHHNYGYVINQSKALTDEEFEREYHFKEPTNDL
jgi:hypothetical protein